MMCLPSFLGELIKAFIYNLLESRLPEEAIFATENFLNMKSTSDVGSTSVYKHHSVLNHCTGFMTPFVNEASNLVSNVAAMIEKQPTTTHQKSLDSDPRYDHIFSLLMNTMMSEYTKALRERDEALASLATASILNDHRIMQEQMARRKDNTQSQLSDRNKHDLRMSQCSDDDMFTLCKQLGHEIAARTNAELEVNRLKERMQFERRLSEAKERDLLAEIAKYKKALEEYSYAK